MKLLFVHQHLGAFGGAEANIHLAARELQRRGHQLALLHGSGTGHSEDLWRELFSQTFRLPDTSKGKAVFAAVDEFNPAAIYVHNMSDLDVLKALTDCGRPVARMVHDHEMYCMRGYKYNYFTRETCRRPASSYCVFPCLGFIGRDRENGLPLKWVSYRAKRREIALNRQFDQFIVYSNFTREELVRNGFDTRKIELNIPIRCWGTEARVSSFSDRNLILYAGQIIRGKGVDVLLKSLAKVKERFECLILGDGSHRPECERLCGNLGLNDRVHFRGFILRDELRNYYLESSVFVLSSVWPEPFGLTGPEAMRYGLPVVAFDAGAIREWLLDGENGFLVPWMNTTKFAQRIDELLRNKDLARQMGRRALELVNDRYNATAQIDKLEAIFERLARRRPLSPPRQRPVPGALTEHSQMRPALTARPLYG
jgi:glycosyltransferase involved in cell wall biosynthesis